MKWITHKTFAVAFTLGLGLPISTIVGSFFGSTLPDQIDYLRSNRGRNREKWYKIHRGFSHFWLVYFIVFIPILYYLHIHFFHTFLDGVDLSTIPMLSDVYNSIPNKIQSYLSDLEGKMRLFDFTFGLFLGALSHLFTDMLNPTGVPLVISKNWKKKFSINICTTNSYKEYIFLGCCGAFIIFYIYQVLPITTSDLKTLFSE